MKVRPRILIQKNWDSVLKEQHQKKKSYLVLPPLLSKVPTTSHQSPCSHASWFRLEHHPELLERIAVWPSMTLHQPVPYWPRSRDPTSTKAWGLTQAQRLAWRVRFVLSWSLPLSTFDVGLNLIATISAQWPLNQYLHCIQDFKSSIT
jgi:hypothetical protein